MYNNVYPYLAIYQLYMRERVCVCVSVSVCPRPSVSPSRCACASVTRVSALQVIVGPPKRNIGFGSFRFPLTRPRFTCRSLIHIRVLYYIIYTHIGIYYNRLR
jgi:hypothetical protein